jgi:hypothetical protein
VLPDADIHPHRGAREVAYPLKPAGQNVEEARLAYVWLADHSNYIVATFPWDVYYVSTSGGQETRIDPDYKATLPARPGFRCV